MFLIKSYQDVPLQKQAWFNGDADTGVAVSLYIAAVKRKKTKKQLIFSCCLSHRVSFAFEHKLHWTGIKVSILYSWRIDWLHCLVDLQERTAACEEKQTTTTKYPQENPGKFDFFLYTWKRQILTSFGLKIGDSVHDHMMQEQRLVVDFDVSRQKAIEVLHIPAEKEKAAVSTKAISTGFSLRIIKMSQIYTTNYWLYNTVCTYTVEQTVLYLVTSKLIYFTVSN